MVELRNWDKLSNVIILTAWENISSVLYDYPGQIYILHMSKIIYRFFKSYLIRYNYSKIQPLPACNRILVPLKKKFIDIKNVTINYSNNSIILHNQEIRVVTWGLALELSPLRRCTVTQCVTTELLVWIILFLYFRRCENSVRILPPNFWITRAAVKN